MNFSEQFEKIFVTEEEIPAERSMAATKLNENNKYLF